jgi:hypothetical protein
VSTLAVIARRLADAPALVDSILGRDDPALLGVPFAGATPALNRA